MAQKDVEPLPYIQECLVGTATEIEFGFGAEWVKRGLLNFCISFLLFLMLWVGFS